MARRLNFEDPETLLYVRIGYATTQIVILGLYYYVSLAVGPSFVHSNLEFTWVDQA